MTKLEALLRARKQREEQRQEEAAQQERDRKKKAKDREHRLDLRIGAEQRREHRLHLTALGKILDKYPVLAGMTVEEFENLCIALVTRHEQDQASLAPERLLGEVLEV